MFKCIIHLDIQLRRDDLPLDHLAAHFPLAMQKEIELPSLPNCDTYFILPTTIDGDDWLRWKRDYDGPSLVFIATHHTIDLKTGVVHVYTRPTNADGFLLHEACDVCRAAETLRSRLSLDGWKDWGEFAYSQEQYCESLKTGDMYDELPGED